MARLHDIDGVTRVSLSKSGAEPVDANVDVVRSPAERRNAAPCGTGNAPPSSSSCSSRPAAAVATTPTTVERHRRARAYARRRPPPRRPTPAHETTVVGVRGPRKGRPREPQLPDPALAVVAIVAVGGYWKLVAAPKRAEAAKLETEVATQQAQLAQTQALITTYGGARDDYETNYATVVRLGKAVPADDDTRSWSSRSTRPRSAAASISTPSTSTAALRRLRHHYRRPWCRGRRHVLGDFVHVLVYRGLQDARQLFSRLDRFVSLEGDRSPSTAACCVSSGCR